MAFLRFLKVPKKWVAGCLFVSTEIACCSNAVIEHLLWVILVLLLLLLCKASVNTYCHYEVVADYS